MTTAIERLIEETRQHDPVLAGQAAIELGDLISVVSELMTEYWKVDESGYVHCRYCAAFAYRGMDIQHRSNCPVKRAQEYRAPA
jgi:hypothetical protein